MDQNRGRVHLRPKAVLGMLRRLALPVQTRRRSTVVRWVLDPPVWRENYGAIAQALAGLDAFSEVYFFRLVLASGAISDSTRNQLRYHQHITTENKSNGGEGGI